MLPFFGVEQIFIDIFGNIIVDILFIVFLLAGAITGILWRPGFGNKVTKLIPREHRFVDFPIDSEYEASIECKESKGFPPQRFFKYAPAFMGQTGKYIKRPSIMYIGKEGTAYTWMMKSGTIDKIGSLSDAVATVWGKDFYEQIPDEQRALLEKSEINVSVDLEQGLTPTNFTPITEEDIYTEEDRKASHAYVESLNEGAKTNMINLIITVLAGVGGGFILAWFLHVGGTTVIQNPTTQMILSFLFKWF